MIALKHKNIKSPYYFKNLMLVLIPRIFYRFRLKSKLNNIKNYNRDDILYRVNYYNKINNQFRVSSKSIKNRGLFTRQLTNIKENVIKKNKSIKKQPRKKSRRKKLQVSRLKRVPPLRKKRLPREVRKNS